MELTFFLKGIVIGFAMAIPLGPIGVMCIRKTLTDRKIYAVVIGLGAATADMLYGSVAAFGLTMISSTLVTYRIWIRLIGGILLLILGVKIFFSKPKTIDEQNNNKSILRTYLSTVFLTLTNPFTIFAFIAVFNSLGLGSGLSYFSAATLVIGIFIGSSAWFFLLSSGVTIFKKRLNLSALKWVNRAAGVLVLISGLITILTH
ncbi:MAG: LysE family transporter [Ignavibacteria bacterium]|nr:LysE family transporter [Ignavibacteria bacterium]